MMKKTLTKNCFGKITSTENVKKISCVSILRKINLKKDNGLEDANNIEKTLPTHLDAFI